MDFYRFGFSFAFGTLFKLILKLFACSFLADLIGPGLVEIGGRVLFNFDIRIQLMVNQLDFSAYVDEFSLRRNIYSWSFVTGTRRLFSIFIFVRTVFFAISLNETNIFVFISWKRFERQSINREEKKNK